MLAMQELQQNWAKMSDISFNKWLFENIELLIEKEKQQIILAHEQGRSDKHNDFDRDGEKYYSEVSDSTDR